jgi:subtilisin
MRQQLVKADGSPARPRFRSWSVRMLVVLSVVMTPLVAGFASTSASAATAATTSRYVVILKDGLSVAQVNADATADGVTPSMTYSNAVSGFAGSMSSASLAKVTSNPDVVMVAPDVNFTSTSTHPHHISRGWIMGPGRRDCATGAGNLGNGTTSYSGPDEFPPATAYQQFIPTNLERIDLQCSPTAHIDGRGPGINEGVAVLDTGIQPNNSDLNVVGGVNCSDEAGSSWADDYGHGTEVGGVLAAEDNGFGVVGAAPGARLYAVKVLDAEDGGDLSNIICGVDWVTAHRNEISVANMSLEGPGANDNDCGLKNHDALHYAICRSVAKGVTYVVAAGNDSSSTNNVVPAAYPEVITVGGWSDTDGRPGGLGATCDGNSDDVFAQFSNSGPSVDLMAVATCITSTYNDNTLVFDDGTSFASPAVAGAAADLLSRFPGIGPEGVKLYLQATGEYGDLINNHGYGLLDMNRD